MKISIRSVLLAALSAVSALAQAPVVGGVSNGYSFQTKLSPGVLASVFGSNLTGNNLTVKLSGMDCPVLFSSPGQLNVQLPWEAAVGPGHVIVTHDGLSSAPFAVTLSKYSPALATDGAGNGIFTSGSNFISPTNPANGGDTLSTLATGLGGTTPAIATGAVTPPPPPLYVTLVTPVVTVGGDNGKVSFSGLAPGFVGQDQVNFTMLGVTPTGNQAVILKIAGVASPAVNIPVGCQQETPLVKITKSALRHGSGNNYTQTVKVQNNSAGTLPATGSLILTSLTSTAKLTNGGGATCPSSDGAPYVSFTLTGTPQTATLTLHFTSTTGTITYGGRVLAP